MIISTIRAVIVIVELRFSRTFKRFSFWVVDDLATTVRTVKEAAEQPSWTPLEATAIFTVNSVTMFFRNYQLMLTAVRFPKTFKAPIIECEYRGL
jgi:hypothetical protein